MVNTDLTMEHFLYQAECLSPSSQIYTQKPYAPKRWHLKMSPLGGHQGQMGSRGHGLMTGLVPWEEEAPESSLVALSLCAHTARGRGGGVPSCKPGEVLNRTRPCGPWPHSQSRELWENKLLLFKPEDKLLLLLWQPEPRFFYCFSGSILWE